MRILAQRGGNDYPVLRIAVMFKQIHSDTSNSGRYGQKIDTGALKCLFKPVFSATWQFNSAMSIKPCNFKTAYGRDSDNVSALDQIVSDLSNEIDVLIDPPQPDVRIQDNHLVKFQSFSEAVSKMLPIIRIFPAIPSGSPCDRYQAANALYS